MPTPHPCPLICPVVCVHADVLVRAGVQLVATAHGNALENVIKNPALNLLVGGIQV